MTDSFERNMSRISEIARALDTGEIPLSASLELYKEAVETLSSMKNQLEEAQGAVVIMQKTIEGAYRQEEARYEF